MPGFTQRSSGKAWYQAFSDVGFHYGPSFQGLEGIQSNPKLYEAAATSPIKYTSGLVAGESRYILHPSSIDLCLQLIIIAIHSGKIKQLKSGFVPLKADEITINAPYITATGKPSAGQAFAWTDKRAQRSVVTGVQLVSNNQVLLDITRLRCISYDAVVPPKIEGEEIMRYWQGSWKPDFSSLRSGDVRSLLARVPEPNQFRFLLELLFFKDSNKKFLEISTSPQGNGEFLQLAGSTFFLWKYDVAFTEEEGMNEAKDEFGTHPQFKFISTSEDLEGVEHDCYDFVLMSLEREDLTSKFLQSIHKTLKPGGSLLLKVAGSK